MNCIDHEELERVSDLNLLRFFAGWIEQGQWDEVPSGVQRRLRRLKLIVYGGKRGAGLVILLSDKAKELLRLRR